MLEGSCDKGYGCVSSQFNPICGINGVTYFSPCYAGCNQEIQLNDVKVYLDCQCVNFPSLNSTSAEDVASYDASNNTCTSSCCYMFALAFIGKAALLLFFFLPWWFYVPPARVNPENCHEPVATMMLNDPLVQIQLNPS